MVRRCPRCGNYAPVCLTYHHGYPYVEYRCGCGWSSLDDLCIISPVSPSYYESETDNKTNMFWSEPLNPLKVVRINTGDKSNEETI